MADEKSKKVANQYERGYDYTKYWDNRDYENAAEHIAIRRLLKGQHYGSAADIGGGFGRLCILLRTFADKVTLAEPAASQLEAAKKVLEGTDILQVQMQADDLKFADGELDLVTMVRVMHHIPEPVSGVRRDLARPRTGRHRDHRGRQLRTLQEPSSPQEGRHRAPQGAGQHPYGQGRRA